jgi:hypothetical protein
MQLLRASFPVRILGGGMVAIGVAGLVIYLLEVGATGDVIGYLVVSCWTAFAVWLGIRTASMGVVSTSGRDLIIRNQFRSHRIPQSDIRGLATRRAFAWWALSPQVLGVVLTGDREVVVEASRALLSPLVRPVSQTEASTIEQMSVVADHIGVRFAQTQR